MMKLHHPTQPSRAGFTLMEVMLAMAVCAVVLAAINGVFFSAVRLRESTTAAVDGALPLEQAMNVVRRDLQGIMLTPSSNKVMSGDFKVGDFTTAAGQNANLEVYTTTGALHDNEPWADVQLVTYSLREPADRTQPGKDFVRSVTRNLLATITPTPQDQLLMDNVATFEVECFDGGQWRNTWDTTQTDTNLPTAIRIRVQLAGPAGGAAPNLQPMELVVPIDLQTSTNQNESAGT